MYYMRVVRHCFDVVFASVAGSITRGFLGSILGPILSFFVIFMIPLVYVLPAQKISKTNKNLVSS